MTITAEKLDYDIAAVFFTGEKIDQAIKSLSEIGIAKDQISLLCTEQAVKDKLDTKYQAISEISNAESTEQLVEEEGTPSTVTAAAGGLTLAASAAGGGAIIATAGIFGGAIAVATAAATVVGGIGALAGAFISKSDADAMQQELDAGHILLLVRTNDASRKEEVSELLSNVSEIKVRVLQQS